MKSLHNAHSRAEATLDADPRFDNRLHSRREAAQDFPISSTRPKPMTAFQPYARDFALKAIPIGRDGMSSRVLSREAGQGEFPVGGAWKRSFDLIVAISALVVMAPLMLFVALLILVTMGRPVLFLQQRVGFRKLPFACFKFRTMVSDAQERLEAHLAQNPEAARRWRETQKLENDPRITWVGRMLRKSSLDELPQLFNILRGEMSCIGPRPVIIAELSRYGHFADDYAKAKPGLTGFWQVSGRSRTTYTHRINCDRYYVRRWSPSLDIAILIRTIPAVLRFKETS